MNEATNGEDRISAPTTRRQVLAAGVAVLGLPALAAVALTPRRAALRLGFAEPSDVTAFISGPAARTIGRAGVAVDRVWLEGLKDQSGSVNHLLIRLRELEREAQASRAVYESFLNRTRELKEQQDVDTSNTAVITPALPPAKPSGLSPVLLLLVAGAIGMSIGAISAVARERIDGRIHTGAQLTALTRLPVLASLPRPHAKAGAARCRCFSRAGHPLRSTGAAGRSRGAAERRGWRAPRSSACTMRCRTQPPPALRGWSF